MSYRFLVFALLVGCSSEDASPGPASAADSTAEVAVDTAVVVDTAVAADTAVVDSTSSDVVDSAPEVDVCSDVGAPCNDTQPCVGSLICYGFGATGFCAPPEPQCGGIVMKMCSGGRTCLRASGSSLGYCATAAEMPCVCGKPDGGKVDGC